MSEYLRQDKEMDKPMQTKLDELQSRLEDFIKQDQDKSAEQGQIIGLGKLSQETDPLHWQGAISLKNRLDKNDLTIGEVIKQHQKLGLFFVDSKFGSAKRCGDGRQIEEYNPESIEWYERSRGVQVFGGTAGDAIGVRLSKGFEPGASFAKDVEITARTFVSDFAPGDHIDDHAEGEKTGCGAIDGEARKNAIYLNPEQFQTLQTVLEFLSNKSGLVIPHDFFNRLSTNAESIQQNSRSYFADKHLAQSNIKELNSNGIEPLTGKHHETSLTLNFVDDTTFDRDRYSSDTEGKIQNFNIDVWAILKEHGENACFVLADQVATALDLTDGTIEVFARVPR